MRCPLKGCAFWGSYKFEGYCSQCFKELKWLRENTSCPKEHFNLAIKLSAAARNERAREVEAEHKQRVMNDLTKLELSDYEVALVVAGLVDKSLTCFVDAMFHYLEQLPVGADVPRFLLSVGQVKWLARTLTGVCFPEDAGQPHGGFQLHIFCSDQTTDWTIEFLNGGSRYLSKYASPNVGGCWQTHDAYVTFQVPLAGESQLRKGHVDIGFEWPLQIRNCDPCNFGSIFQHRQEQKQRLLALAMGTHPRLGAASPVILPEGVLENNIAPFILNDNCFSSIKWLHHNSAWLEFLHHPEAFGVRPTG